MCLYEYCICMYLRVSVCMCMYVHVCKFTLRLASEGRKAPGEMLTRRLTSTAKCTQNSNKMPLTFLGLEHTSAIPCVTICTTEPQGLYILRQNVCICIILVTYIHIHTHTYIYIQIHTDTYRYIHICTPSKQGWMGFFRRGSVRLRPGGAAPSRQIISDAARGGITACTWLMGGLLGAPGTRFAPPPNASCALGCAKTGPGVGPRWRSKVVGHLPWVALSGAC